MSAATTSGPIIVFRCAGGMAMLTRSNLICLVLLAVVPLAAAKNKQVLPNYVLHAQTVAVVIMPDAGESGNGSSGESNG